jgi:hypothetical protein
MTKHIHIHLHDANRTAGYPREDVKPGPNRPKVGKAPRVGRERAEYDPNAWTASPSEAAVRHVGRGAGFTAKERAEEHHQQGGTKKTREQMASFRQSRIEGVKGQGPHKEAARARAKAIAER